MANSQSNYTSLTASNSSALQNSGNPFDFHWFSQFFTFFFSLFFTFSFRFLLICLAPEKRNWIRLRICKSFPHFLLSELVYSPRSFQLPKEFLAFGCSQSQTTIEETSPRELRLIHFWLQIFFWALSCIILRYGSHITEYINSFSAKFFITAGNAGVCMISKPWRDEQHTSFINFVSSFLSLNSFRLNIVPLAPVCALFLFKYRSTSGWFAAHLLVVSISRT